MLNAVLIFVTLMAFGAIHSAFASHTAKALAQRIVGADFAAWVYRLFFNFSAVLTVLPVMYLVWTLPDHVLYRFPEPLNYLAVALQALTVLGMLYALYQMDFLFFAGLRQLIDPLHTSIESTSTAQLVTHGLHRYVRHPLYTTSLIILYLASPMSVNWLAFAVSCNVYFCLGSIFEERKLLREFGDAYRAYQQRVPRLLPRPWR
jgi:protein-S-isoprenylcysteine O-methyltransferase Ste14